MSEVDARQHRRGRKAGGLRPPSGVTAAALGAGRPTLRTIAGMTGLNATTISRALNNAPELSAETRERVQKIAAEIGYVPDRTALRLKTGRTHVVGLVLDPLDEMLGFGQSMVSGIAEALRGTSYHLVITPNFGSADPIDPIRYILRNKAADGVIFSRTQVQDERVKLLLENDFPFVSHGRTEVSQPHPFVDYDNFAFARQAVRRLAGKGRRHIATILPPAGLTFGRHLREGFMAGIAEAGLRWAIPDAVSLDSPADDVRRFVIALMQTSDPPDGFVCPGDGSAMAVIAGIWDAGRTIGKDVDVVAKQTSRLFSQVRPKVDAIFEDTMLAGRQMGELLLRRIGGGRPEELQILHVPENAF